MESDSSATFASKQLGQFEEIAYFTSDNSGLTQSVSAQRNVRDAVMPSEFFQIKPTNPKNGLTGYFVSPEFGAYRGTVAGSDIQPVVVSEAKERLHGIRLRPESDQWIREWKASDRRRLSLVVELAPTASKLPKRKLSIRRPNGLGSLKIPSIEA